MLEFWTIMYVQSDKNIVMSNFKTNFSPKIMVQYFGINFFIISKIVAELE